MRSELPEEIQSRVLRIRSNNTSGAIALSRDAAKILIALAEYPGDFSADQFKAQVAQTARDLINAQPAMAPIFNLVNSTLLRIECLSSLDEMRDRVKENARNFIDHLKQAIQHINRIASELIRDGVTVLTHSYSETVLNAFTTAHGAGKQFDVICTESRPMQEGITLATKLAQAGIRVTLIADAAMLSRIPATRIVLVGADSVSTSGLVNKMGTSMLALAAKSLKKDFYSVCTTEKFLPARYQLPQEPAKPAKEITEKDVPNLAVSNYYFDITPLDWLTAVVTESGKLGPEELKQRLRRMKVHPALV